MLRSPLEEASDSPARGAVPTSQPGPRRGEDAASAEVQAPSAAPAGVSAGLQDPATASPGVSTGPVAAAPEAPSRGAGGVASQLNAAEPENLVAPVDTSAKKLPSRRSILLPGEPRRSQRHSQVDSVALTHALAAVQQDSLAAATPAGETEATEQQRQGPIASTNRASEPQGPEGPPFREFDATPCEPFEAHPFSSGSDASLQALPMALPVRSVVCLPVLLCCATPCGVLCCLTAGVLCCLTAFCLVFANPCEPLCWSTL